MSGKSGVVVLVGLGVFALVCSSVFYTVDQRELALLMHFSKPVDKVIEPGLHVKWPVISTVQRYDSRLRVLPTRAITYVDKDNKPVILQAYLCWRVIRPLPFYRNLRTVGDAEEKIRQIANSALRISVSKYAIDEMVSTDVQQIKMPQIERELKSKVIEDLKELAPGAVEVPRAGIYRLAFPDASEQAVYEEMKSDREVDRSDYESRGKQRGAEIMAEADKEAEKIIAKAIGDAGKIRGEGEARATEIYRKAYELDRDFYVFWHTLQTYKKIFGPETTLVLPPDDELLRHFRMPKVGTAPKGPGQ